MKQYLTSASCSKEIEGLLFRRIDDLSPSEQRVLDDHLTSCPTCTLLHKNFMYVEACVGNLPLLQSTQALSPELLQSKQKHKLLSSLFRYWYALPQVSQIVCSSLNLYDAPIRHQAKRSPGHRVNPVIALTLVVILLTTVMGTIISIGSMRLSASAIPFDGRPPSLTYVTPQADNGQGWLVTTLADSGPGSLRMAIDDAVPGSTITFDANLGGTILLTHTLSITKSVSIRGPGEGTLTIGSRTVVPGSPFGVQVGPSSDVSVVISNLHFMGIASINNRGTLKLMNSMITGNTRGGILNSGTLTITNSTIAGNIASSGNGGGILNSGTLTITNSTIAGNIASSGNGGGIASAGGTADITFSTIVGNEATNGSDIWTKGSQVMVRNSIVAQNHAYTGLDISGTLTSNGYNLIQNATDATFTPNKQHLTDVLVDPRTDLGIDPLLRDNGGPTWTLALLPGSPAINKIPLDVCRIDGISTDQRGVKRPGGNDQLCDIGAYELIG